MTFNKAIHLNDSWAPAGGTAFVLDQHPAPHNYGAGQGNGGSYGVTLPAIAANSLCLLAFTQFGPTVPFGSVVDQTASLTWTALQDGNNGGLCYAFYAASQSAGNSLAVSILGSVSNAAYSLATFTGATSLQLDTGASFVQGGTNVPTWTTSINNTLAVGWVQSNNGTETPTTPGWNVLGNGTDFVWLVYKITGAATLSAETLGSDGSTGHYASSLIAFK